MLLALRDGSRNPVHFWGGGLHVTYTGLYLANDVIKSRALIHQMGLTDRLIARAKTLAYARHPHPPLHVLYETVTSWQHELLQGKKNLCGN